MKIVLVLIFLFLITSQANAQVQLSAGAGLTDSVNMGEIGPSSFFKSTFSVGGRLRLENDLVFSPMDKYTEAGWFASDSAGVLIFPSEGSGFFIVGGADYTHRNGGPWAKDGVLIGGGVGYEKKNSQLKFSIKERAISLNDNIKYSPYIELLARGDIPLNGSLSLRLEAEVGSFRYLQNNLRNTAFYLNSILGLVYRWP